MPNGIWLLISIAAVGVGAVLGIIGGPEGDTWSALAFSIFAIGVAVAVAATPMLGKTDDWAKFTEQKNDSRGPVAND
jgi:hypothetical protein